MTVACGGARVAFPGGPATPSPDALTHWAAATEACRGARTFSAEIQVNGHVGDEPLRRATLQGAMTRDGAIRLLAVAPAGPPIFTLAGRANRATLTLPSERRVIVAPAADIVDALVGLKLGPVDWLDLLAGCVAGSDAAEGARFQGATIVSLKNGSGRVRIDQEGTTWRVVAGERPDLLVEYPEAQGRWPRVAQVTSRPGAVVSVALNMAISQINVNLEMRAELFMLDVAPDFRPMTIDELRAMGPLGPARRLPTTFGGR